MDEIKKRCNKTDNHSCASMSIGKSCIMVFDGKDFIVQEVKDYSPPLLLHSCQSKRSKLHRSKAKA